MDKPLVIVTVTFVLTVVLGVAFYHAYGLRKDYRCIAGVLMRPTASGMWVSVGEHPQFCLNAEEVNVK